MTSVRNGKNTAASSGASEDFSSIDPTYIAPTSQLMVDVRADDIAHLYRANQAAWQTYGMGPEGMYPNLGTGRPVFSKDLEGIPFAFKSGTELVHFPEKRLTDGSKIAAQDGIRVYVRPYSMEDKTWLDIVLATFTDAYLVNQLRAATEEQLIDSGLWTIGRNSKFSTPSGPPRMLKRYEYGRDKRPPRVHIEENDRWADSEPVTANGAQTRAQRTAERADLARINMQYNTSRVDAPTQAVHARMQQIAAAQDSQEAEFEQGVENLPWEDETSEVQSAPPVKRGPGRPKGSGKRQS